MIVLGNSGRPPAIPGQTHAASGGVVAEPLDAEQTPVGPEADLAAGRLGSLSQLERPSVAVMVL